MRAQRNRRILRGKLIALYNFYRKLLFGKQLIFDMVFQLKNIFFLYQPGSVQIYPKTRTRPIGNDSLHLRIRQQLLHRLTDF